MKIRRGTARMIEALKLVEATDFLRLEHERLTSEGYALREKARAYACKDGTLSLQFTWTRRRPDETSTFTVSTRVRSAA